ncbi:MAG: HlyD family efflux transporter periplasmic adaptor subunit [Polyangiaceae bacterium]
MINNSLVAPFCLGCALLLPACTGAPAEQRVGYQGVAELDERRLAFEVTGRLVSLTAREGDAIASGSLLATLNGALDAQAREAGALEARALSAQSALVERGTRPEDIAVTRARLRAARSSEQLANKELERERALFESGVTARASLDTLESAAARAEAEREALENELAEQERGARPEEREVAKARAAAAHATVDLDQLRLDLRELRAPLDAEVLDVLVEPGEVVMAGAPVLLVADPAHPFAEVFVPQAELAGIDVGDEARVTSDSLTQPLAGKIEHVARTTEFTPRYLFSERERPNLVVRVKVRIDDPQHLLHAGVPVFVGIERAAARATAAR